MLPAKGHSAMSIRRLLSAVALAGAAALALSACAPSTPSSTGGGSAAESSLTIKHALGTTTVPEKPERIATVNWANHEVPLALGVVPVGMARANFGDDDGNGLLPWVEEKLEELGVPAALVGALLVLAADFVGQWAFGTRYPVGVITGVLGAPYLVALIIRSNRTGGSL